MGYAYFWGMNNMAGIAPDKQGIGKSLSLKRLLSPPLFQVEARMTQHTLGPMSPEERVRSHPVRLEEVNP